VLGSVRLTLLLGPKVPVPAPPPLLDALDHLEVTHSDAERSGFQITFQAGRSGLLGALDYPLLSSPLLRPFNRVVLVVTFGVVPRVLMDGIITNVELAPSDEPGASTLTVTGEDVSVMMDLEEKSVEHPAQDETIIANKILLSYAEYGVLPKVMPPIAVDPPVPVERIPVQQGTDLGYLQAMAERHGYVFYVAPGPVPLMNLGYWGPPVRMDLPQRALSVGMGPESNVTNISFRNDGLAPEMVEGRVQDRLTNQAMPVMTAGALRVPLSTQPGWLVNQPNVRRTQLRESGLNIVQVLARAQGRTDASSDAVTAEGELDALRYGAILEARGLVGLRGAGYTHDGFYYVQRVTHTIRRGEYKQRFTLKREGVGSTTPVVVP
jgi:hypothetical protein